NQKESAALTALGLPRVALKRGSHGASLFWDGEVFHCPAYPVTVYDTTGAGDCFDAGFLASWLRGESPETCLRAGVFCGSLSTRKAGGLAGFPTAKEFEEWRTGTK